MGNHQQAEEKQGTLTWWQLSLIGVGCIIGTGFFLGSSIAIKQSGPGVVLIFALAAIGTYIVFEALAKLTADHPEKGSFRSYAKNAFGRWAGFSTGWVYWSSEILITGSQLTALGIFTKLWFPNVPLWLLMTVYAVLGLLVVITGVKGFEKAENIFAVIKIAAILMFISIAFAAVFGQLDSGPKDVSLPKEFLPNGVKGLWTGLIFAFYAFGGIEVMGLMANELKDKKSASKSGTVMLSVLAIIYVLSLGLAVMLVKWDEFSTKKSPFVVALKDYDLAFVPHIFNGALIIAGFSTMAASLFAITNILTTLASEGDAPNLFTKTTKKREIPIPAIGLTSTGLLLSIVMAILLPEQLYEHITTAAGLMLLYTWIFILLSYKKILTISVFANIKRWIGMILILLAVSGASFDKSSRTGFFVSLGFILVIGIITVFMNKKFKRNEPIKN